MAPQLIRCLLPIAVLGFTACRRAVLELPPPPDLTGAPTELQTRFADASAAASANPSIDAVATLGRLAHANDLLPTAQAVWRHLMVIDPSQAEWPYLLADLYQIAGDEVGRAQLLNRTTELAPDYAPAWLQLAELRFKAGDLAGAAIAYQRRLDLLPGDPYARLGLARCARHLGHADEARERIDALVADTPGFAPARNLRAELLAAAGNEAAATHERFLGAQATRFRDAPDPWREALIAVCYDYDKLCVRGMMDALTDHGDRGQALFERARRLRPDRLTAYELLGNLHLDANAGARAVAIYEAGLAAAPAASPPAAYFEKLSRAYLLRGDPGAAIAACHRGIARAGAVFELQHALGNAHRAAGQTEAAAAAYRAAIQLQPHRAVAHHDLALTLLDQHELDAAVATLHRALEANPQFPASLALLGQIEIDSGRWQSAARYLQPLFDAQPDLPEARARMSGVLLRAGAEAEREGKPDDAVTAYQRGAAITPDNAQLQARLGVLLLLEGRADEAVLPLEAFHRLQPQAPQSAFHLGRVYAAVGRTSDARALLQRAIDLAVTNHDAAIAQRAREFLAALP